MTRTAVLLIAAGVVVVPGCGPTPLPPFVEVEGVVTLGGQPLPKATVTFMPALKQAGGEAISVAETDDAGRFRLQCGARAGAYVCEHVVTVTEGSLPAELRNPDKQAEMGRYQAGQKNRPIPPKYGNAATTPLKVVVKADQKEYEVALSR